MPLHIQHRETVDHAKEHERQFTIYGLWGEGLARSVVPTTSCRNTLGPRRMHPMAVFPLVSRELCCVLRHNAIPRGIAMSRVYLFGFTNVKPVYPETKSRAKCPPSEGHLRRLI